MTTRATEHINYDSFFERGESFALTVSVISKYNNEAFLAFAAAMAVTYAFTIEVYLKVLAHLDHGLAPLKTHNLLNLFDDLSSETREKIETKWTEQYEKSENRKKEKALMDDMFKDCKEKTDFRRHLEVIKDAFVLFRYETSETYGMIVTSLGGLLRSEILRRKPEWKPEAGTPYALINPHPDFVKNEANGLGITPIVGPNLKYQSPSFKVQVGGRFARR